MKNIKPIFALVLSAVCFIMSGLCLSLMILVAYVGMPVALSAFAVPCLIVDCFTTALSTGTNFMFMKSKICLAGFIVSLSDICLIVATFIIMFTF